MPLFAVPEDDNDIINDPNSFSGISSPSYNASYVGQTIGPVGMGMSTYMDRPETQPGYTSYDYSPGYDTNTYNLGQTYGPTAMGMSAYMDRPGPMQMAAAPTNIGYDRMGPDPDAGILRMMPKGERFNPNVVMAGLPFNLFQDPTADGGIIDYFSRKLFGDDDPENDFDYEPLPDDFKGGIPPGSMTETLEANADSYSLPNLLQMLQDARDAGNVDEMELLTNDLEMMYPGATMDVATALPANLALDMLANPRYPDDVNIQNLIKIYGPDVFDNLPSFEGLDGNIYGNPNISKVLG